MEKTVTEKLDGMIAEIRSGDRDLSPENQITLLEDIRRLREMVECLDCKCETASLGGETCPRCETRLAQAEDARDKALAMAEELADMAVHSTRCAQPYKECNCGLAKALSALEAVKEGKL